MPSDTRVKPAVRNRANSSGDVDSGLASVVTSAPGASEKFARTASSTAASRSPPSIDGVPPPTKTVDTSGTAARSDASRAAARSSSIRSASSQPSGFAPPSSAGV